MILNTADIFDKGYKAHQSGKKLKDCPYSQVDLKHCWQAGWRASRDKKAAVRGAEHE